MQSRELLSPEGLRVDGRRPNELRKIHCKIGVFNKADGSSYFEQGNTKVLATVFGPHEVTVKSKALHDRAIVNCEYSMAPFSTGERKKKSKGDRRATEISLVIKQTFEAAIITSLLPRSQIDIFCQVLQADGGTRCAAINAATLALIDAGIPLVDFVVACAVGYIDETPILDLNYLEDSSGNPDIPVAIFPKTNKIAMLQMDSKLPLDKLEKVLTVAIDGCQRIYQHMVDVTRNNAQNLFKNFGILNF
jgi:exosome complex component RRP41